MKTLRLIPILGRKTDVLPDDDSMLKMVSEGVALSHDAGGQNFDLKRKINACTKSFGTIQRSVLANAQKTLCMGLFELYDGTSRNHIFFDNGKAYYYDSSWEPVELPDTYLHFDAQTGSFTVGNTITGATSGATATIVFVYDAGTTGTLFLEGVVGTFQNNEIIYESALSSEYITDSDNRNFADGTINEWVILDDCTDAECVYEGTDPSAEKVMEIKCTTVGAGTYCMGSLPTANMTALENGSFYIVTAKFYIESANTLDDIALYIDSVDLYPSAAHWDGQNKGEWLSKTACFMVDGADIDGNLVAGFYGAPTDGDILYVDDISVKKITNAALANGTVTATTFANDNTDLYSIIRVGSYMVFADMAEHTPMKWTNGDGTLSTLVATGTQYKFRYLIPFQRRVIGLYSDQTNGNIDIRWSTDWPSTAITSLNFPAGNQLYIPNDDPIVGGGLMGRDYCFIFCENSIQQLVYYPDYATPFRCYTVVPDMGAENHHSIVAANGRLYFYNRDYGFCEYSGGVTVTPISNDILSDFKAINAAYNGLIVGKHVPQETKIKWTMPLGGLDSCDAIVSYNYNTGQWEIEDKVARWIDEWLLYSGLTWTQFEVVIGGTGIWSDAGTTRWSDYTTAKKEVIIGHTDGHFYGVSGETYDTMDGYRIEPVLHFGNRRTFKTLLEIWFDIGESGSFSIDVYHRSGDTTGEIVNSSWTSIGSVSCNNPSAAEVIDSNGSKPNKVARLHQIKWGTDADNEKFVVNGIVFKYTEGGER